MKLRNLILTALFGVILFVQQVLLSGLPNIHLCAVLIILYSLYFPKLSFPAVGIFILLEGLMYGFGMWWLNYLYIWPLLVVICFLFRKVQSMWFWVALSGIYGFSFGALCSLPYFFIGGPIMAFNYWVSGIPFDLTHGIGNMAALFILWKPLSTVFQKCILANHSTT